MQSLLAQPALGIEGGHAAAAGSRHSLAVDLILCIARGKNTRYIGIR